MTKKANFTKYSEEKIILDIYKLIFKDQEFLSLANSSTDYYAIKRLIEKVVKKKALKLSKAKIKRLIKSDTLRYGYSYPRYDYADKILKDIMVNDHFSITSSNGYGGYNPSLILTSSSFDNIPLNKKKVEKIIRFILPNIIYSVTSASNTNPNLVEYILKNSNTGFFYNMLNYYSYQFTIVDSIISKPIYQKKMRDFILNTKSSQIRNICCKYLTDQNFILECLKSEKLSRTNAKNLRISYTEWFLKNFKVIFDQKFNIENLKYICSHRSINRYSYISEVSGSIISHIYKLSKFKKSSFTKRMFDLRDQLNRVNTHYPWTMCRIIDNIIKVLVNSMSRKECLYYIGYVNNLSDTLSTTLTDKIQQSEDNALSSF
jgi:hypothetical protein